MPKVQDRSEDTPRLNVLQAVCLHLAALAAAIVTLRLLNVPWTTALLVGWGASGFVTVIIAALLTSFTRERRPALRGDKGPQNARAQSLADWDEDASDEAWHALAVRRRRDINKDKRSRDLSG